MKKKILFLTSLLMMGLGLISVAVAAPDINSLTENVAGKAGYDTSGVTDTTISKTVGGLIRGVLGVVGVIFLALTVYAGILWMTAGGNEDKVSRSQKILVSSFIGLVVVAAAYGITALVMTFVFRASAPEGRITPGSENLVDRKMGCCWLEGTNQCWNFATPDQCTGRWFSDVQCNNMGVEEGINCIPQN